jgi:hypothetical protein
MMMLRFKSLLAAAAFGVMASVSATPVSAQLFADDVIHPVEILDYLYGSGYSNVRRPRLRGDVYVVVATDDNGRRVQLAIDAYDGRLLQRKMMGRDPSVRRRNDRVDGPRFAEDDAYAGRRDDDSSVEIDSPKAKPKQKPKVAAKPKPKKQVAAAKPEDKGPLVAPGATRPKVEPDEPVAAKPAQPPRLVAAKPPVATPEATVAAPQQADEVKPVEDKAVAMAPAVPKIEIPALSFPKISLPTISLPKVASPKVVATTPKTEPKPLPEPQAAAPQSRREKPRVVMGPPMPPKPLLAAPSKLATPPRLTDSAKPTVTPAAAPAAATVVKPRIIRITPPADLDAPALPVPPPLRTTPVAPVVGLD